MIRIKIEVQSQMRLYYINQRLADGEIPRNISIVTM